MRARQVSSMFEVPAQEKTRLDWSCHMKHDERDWRIGLIVGPSGSGKSSLLFELFGDERPLSWNAESCLDDFDEKHDVETIASVCSAVGFNTIPAWLRPYDVLSNGEQFRIEIARKLLEDADPIVVDEFTSVVDRQVAQVACHAVQKFVRKQKRQLVAASCHYDIIDWLQPDWTYDVASDTFTWRSLQQRPALDVTVAPVRYETWKVFAPFHYMSAALNKSARCFALFVGDKLASFAAMLHFPHPKRKNIKACSRLVTHPDFQGLGLAFALINRLGAAYRALGYELRCYPAHPSFIRSYQRSSCWTMKRKMSDLISKRGPKGKDGCFGSRYTAVFAYCGSALDVDQARRLIDG